jgi:hypothetical protein
LLNLVVHFEFIIKEFGLAIAKQLNKALKIKQMLLLFDKNVL